jgi:hypothetical protein
MEPSKDELPALVAVNAVVGGAPDVVVLLRGVDVFSDGVALRLEWAARRGDRDGDGWQALQGAFSGGRWGGPQQAPADELRFGVELADGQRIIADEVGGIPEREPSGPTLRFLRSGGSGGLGHLVHHGLLWLWSLPPEGELQLVTEWRALGIPQTTFGIDTAPLLAAVERVRPLWQ